jgi:hypothetical protein
MNIKNLEKSKYIILLTVFLVIILSSCATDRNKDSDGTDTISEDFNAELDDDLIEKINTAKKIFYSLPSPLETAMLIKNAGASYEERLLNTVNNTDKYNTNLEMALNLGIFTTDLSYASLFDQTQATLNYVNAAKKMADGLEILDAIDEETIQRLEENINNREIIIDIISETLLNSTSFLEDRGLQATSAVILVGGWIEGLHIATSLINPESADLKKNKLVERIVDQKLSLNIIISMLENNKDNVEAQSVLKDVLAIRDIYEKITIKQSEITAVEDPNTNVTTLKSESSIEITPAVFKELATKIAEIRTRYIS